jgi:kinesin family protein 3/17
MHPVQSVVDCEKLMDQGWKNRATGATLMNADSSRSHSIFSISLEMMPLCALEDTGCSADGDHIRRGKLSLVDLAGSERQAKTGNKKVLDLMDTLISLSTYPKLLYMLRPEDR